MALARATPLKGKPYTLNYPLTPRDVENIDQMFSILYKGMTVDVTGSGGSVATTDLTGTLQAAQFPALTGDVTTVAGAVATTLAVSGVTAATYGDSSHTPQIAIDAKGRVTSASNVAISGGSGKIAQVVNTETGATASGTTGIPIDDTIPQNTEGDQYLSLAITPTSSSNKLLIEVTLFCSGGAADTWLIAALFQDSTAGALAAGTVVADVAFRVEEIRFSHYMTAGTTSATTFKVRAGKHTGASGTFVVNGNNGGRLLGGVLVSNMTITEIIP